MQYIMDDDSLIELDYIQLAGGPGSIVTEIGQTRRRERSFKKCSGNLRRNNIVGELPSRKKGVVLVGGDTVDGTEEILHHLENDLDDTTKSIKERAETLREMPQSLTIKRRAKEHLRQSTGSRQHSISFLSKIGYSISYAFHKGISSLKSIELELWYQQLKTVEGHHGSGVATYFRFLRSLFLINLLVFVISLCLIVVPQAVIYSGLNATGPVSSTFKFGNIFTGEGYLADSVLFYGYYSNMTSLEHYADYNMPAAYFFAFLLCYLLVFLLLSISLALSYRENYIAGEGAATSVFASKLFSAWDFGIASAETANLKHKSIHTEFKEYLDEMMVNKQKHTWPQVLHNLGLRLSLNLFLLSVVSVGAFYTWKFLSSQSKEEESPQTSMMISLALTIVVHVGPIVFSWLLRYEDYDSPRTGTYVTLVRTLILDAVVIAIVLAYRLKSADDSVCWETALGQEVYRLVLLDFLVGLVGTTLAQFVRFRIYSTVWAGIGCPHVDVARNTINLLYNQTLLYVGLLFSPLLPLVILVKLVLTFYAKYWGAVHHCRPSRRMWRAAQTEMVFLTSAFAAFVAVLIFYGYILSSVKTSSCGPFRGEKVMYFSVVDILNSADSSSKVLRALLYVLKPGVVATVLLAMLLTAYYLRAVARARARVLRILKEVLQLQAKDKEYLLDALSHLSNKGWVSPVPGDAAGDVSVISPVRKRSTAMPRPTPRQTTQNFLERDRKVVGEELDGSANDDFTFVTPRKRAVQIQNGHQHEDMRAVFTPTSADDRIPSRIPFP